MNLLEDDLDHILAHTREVWEDLRGRRIFITGGTGFFGCWLLESFSYANEKLKLGASAVVLTRNADVFRSKAPYLAAATGVELLEGDVTSFPFPAGEFSYLIHAAVDYADPLRLFLSTIEGTRRTLEFARASGVRKYLLTSSGAVYGRQPPSLSCLPETYNGAPDIMQTRSAYGEAKRSSEFLCAAFHETYGLETVIARGFAFVGPYLSLRVGSAIGNFIGDVLQRRPITILGDGTPYRSYLYGADLAIWLWTILCRGASCRPYNLGSDAALSIREVAQIVVDVLQPGAQVQVMSEGVPGRAAERYTPCIDRARKELDLESWIDIHDGVRRTASWYRKTE